VKAGSFLYVKITVLIDEWILKKINKSWSLA
jgi:hypothetical protein